MNSKDGLYDKGDGDWDVLMALIDRGDYTVSDLVAIICASMRRQEVNDYDTEIMVGGDIFTIKIERKGRILQ